MTDLVRSLRQIRWIVQKDIQCELRSFHATSRMAVLGVMIGFLLNYQTDLPAEHMQRIAASFCWITISIAAILNLGHTIMSEQEDDCWELLLQYPTSAETTYVAKLVTNGLTLSLVQLVLIPFFAITAGVTWLAYPWQIGIIAVLANVGITSLGTLFAASVARDRNNQGTYTVILLPLLLPVMLAAAEATRLLGNQEAHEMWQRWIMLLGTFAVVYVTLGWLLFAYLIED